MKTRTITAPAVVKALRELGISNRKELMAIPQKELRAKLKAMGATQYLRRFVLRWLQRADMDFTVGKLEGEYTKEDLVRISLRDYFAARAMEGQFTALWRGELEEPAHCVLSDLTAETVAESAYKMADAMLKKR